MHERNETTTRRIANAALAVLFAAGIAVPCVGTFVALDTGGIPGENRAMAPTPIKGPLGEFPARLKAWCKDYLFKGKFTGMPKRFEASFNDNFGLRNSLVRTHSRLEYEAFGVSSSSYIVLGKGRWLFYAGDRIIESRRGLIPFTAVELRTWQTALEERRDWLASQDIRYVFMIAPEKSSLYAEFLPDTLAPVREETRLDQLVAWMRAHSTVEVLDLRESLRAAKADGRVFHWTDTHWNDVGAFAAYRQLAAWVHSQFPDLKPLEADGFGRQVHPGQGGDLAGMLAMMTRLPEEYIVLVPKTRADVREGALTDAMKKRAWVPGQGPAVTRCTAVAPICAVVLHDSFFLQVRPFLSRTFSRVTYVWWTFPPEIIADEKPQVVIEEMIERLLSRPGFLPVNEPPVAGFRNNDQ